MRVLIAETNWNTMTAAVGMEDAGILVTRVNDGRELMDFADFGEQSAIVFDLDMPDINGAQLVEVLRRKSAHMPIYALTESADWDLRKSIYDAGADDVITGPVQPAALAAQLKAAVRRAAGYSSKILTLGALTIDTECNTARVRENHLQLTRKEYEILEILTLNKERLITRDGIMNHLYAWDDEPDSKIINVYLSRIRQQIELAGGDQDMIETVWGLGYRATDLPVSRMQA